jgi:hypothetical protein
MSDLPSETQSERDDGEVVRVELRRPGLGDELEPARQAIAFRLIWLLMGIIAGSGVGLALMLILNVKEGAHFVLD